MCARSVYCASVLRRGATLVLVAVMMVVLLGMIAFAVDVGYVCLTRSQVQNAADAASVAAAAQLASGMDVATAAAVEFAGYNWVGGKPVAPGSVSVQYGTWDTASRSFTQTEIPGNAVRATVQRDAEHDGNVPLFFGPVLGKRWFSVSASAIAMTNPRDIAFVIDLSGSMNNDTEPCWATSEIDEVFGPQGYPDIAEELMQQLYDDFGFGTFPGTLEYIGQPLGVAQDQYAYAEMTKNGGPLAQPTIAATYRILDSDSEATRKQKAYKWVIDNQLAVLMPNAKPTPVSSDTSSYAYWEKYLDFVVRSQSISSSSPKGRPRPSYPVTLPPSQSGNRISGFGNPYTAAFPGADSSTPLGYRNRLGYRTYVQFLMDFGRDAKPVSGQYGQLSRLSPYCPWHDEATDGGTFRFPPREQPTHAARRAIIAAIQVIKERNQGVSDPNQKDWVSILTYDRVSGAAIAQSLTADYDEAMQACTTLQAAADNAANTATETGLLTAKNHIRPQNEGGSGRLHTNKVVVLLTDGIPNLKSSSTTDISSFISLHPSADFYTSGSYKDSKNAALMQSMDMQLRRWYVFPVGIGLGTDYEFMDRSARLGGTANQQGECPRGSGNPAEYENRLREIFQNIITNPKARLVQ